MSFSADDISPYGIKYSGPGIIFSKAKVLSKLVQEDHGLPQDKKTSLLRMLNSPEIFDHIMAGVAGMVLSNIIAKYAKMSQPARTLVTLAGFGLGNVIYNAIMGPRKHTSYDPETGTVKIL
jgi:hypothetical protein